jgi:hypothetical protein
MKKKNVSPKRIFPDFRHQLETFRDIRSRKYPFLRQTVFIGDTKHSLPWLVWKFLIFVQSFRCISLSNFIRSKNDVKGEQYTKIEIYVLSWFIVSLILLCGVGRHMKASNSLPLIISILIVGIVGYRLADILSAQLGIIFIDRHKNGGICSLDRSLLLLGINYFEIIVGFAIMYLATSSIGYSNCSNILMTPTKALYFSAVTMTTLGCSDMKPASSCGMTLVALEPILGLILIVLVIGAFFTFYARK